MTFELPDLDRPFDHENGFYLSCDVSRIAKFAAHLELFKRTVELPGAIVECGVFKGASLARFATFRQLFGGVHSKPIIAFDVFGPFPESTYSDDADARSTFVAEAGSESISVSDMERVLQHKQIRDNIELVAGDLTRTLPDFVRRNPELRVCLLNLDTDLYAPARVILDELWPRVVPGGVVLLDDYGVFAGESAAVDEYFRDGGVTFLKLPWAHSPTYIVK